MLDKFKSVFWDTCEFKVVDGELQYPDCHKERIFFGSYCDLNPTECYESIPDSPFAKTKVPIRMHKKTGTVDNGYATSVLTEIVVPSETDIHFGKPDCNDRRKNRVARGVVGKQLVMLTNTETDSSKSLYFNSFEYITGKLVKPKEPFYGYDDWVRQGKYNVDCQSGIHVFSNEKHAREFRL